MNINLHESISEKKNDIIERIVFDRLEKYCSCCLDSEFEDILRNPNNKKFKKIILDTLEKYGFNFYSFYNSELIDAAICNKEILTNGLLIKEFNVSENNMELVTEHGTFKATMLAETLNDTGLLTKKYQNLLLGHCHELTTDMLEKNRLLAVTAFCPYSFRLDILHSYNIGDNNKIYDVSHNLIMDYDDYKKIFSPLEISFVSYDEYINSKEYDDYKNYRTKKFPVYNIACKRAKQINIRKLKKEVL